VQLEILNEKPENSDLFSISVSKIKQFKNCKAAYKHSYIDKLTKKTWDFNVFGSFLHEVLETYHQFLIDHPDSKYHEVLKDCFWKAYPTYEKQLLSDDLWTIVEDAKGIKNPVQGPYKLFQLNAFKKETFALAGLYLQNHGKALKENRAPDVESVEKAFYFKLDDKYLLNGFIDRVDRHPDGFKVLDYKSSNPRSRKYLAEDLFQLQTYSYVIWTLNPDIQKIHASYVLLRDQNSPIETTFEISDIENVAENMVNQAKLMQAEVGFKETPGTLCRYCSNLENCKPGADYVHEQNIKQLNRAKRY